MADMLGFDIAASGLTAQRLRMDVISNNIANAQTTRTAEGGPYRKKSVVFESRLKELLLNLPVENSNAPAGNGVRVGGIVEDKRPPLMVYDPSHPDADATGYVAMPNVNMVNEMVDLMSATRAYEANVMSLNAAKGMAATALEILRV
jgi:flagellar basal-body rod protein FlgC